MARHSGDPNIRDAFVVTIDGPAGSGKTTTARGVARSLGLTHVDTGAMYRAVTLAALRAGVDLSDDAALGRIAVRSRIEFHPADAEQGVFLDGNDVTREIRSPEVTAGVSEVSAVSAVRSRMVFAQRALVRQGGAVLEGRDTGSVVVPWADVKVYLDATLERRAARRHSELAVDGASPAPADIARELERRDRLDSARALSPLSCPVGAHRMDTSELTIEEQVERTVELVRRTRDALARLAREGADGDFTHRRWFYRLTQASVRSLGRAILGLRVESPLDWSLGENYIFASNHKSNIDPPAVGCTLRREAYYVAKSTLFRNPILGSILRRFNAFPIRRGAFDREAMDLAGRLLARGESLLIFPEGGRVRTEGIGRARSGVGVLAIRSGVPVVPVYIDGSARLRDCLVRKRRIRVFYGRPIRIPPELLRDLQARAGREDYRRYAEMVMSGISALRDVAVASRAEEVGSE